MIPLRRSEHPVVRQDVRDIQNMLNTIRLNEHAQWPYLDADGKFGKDTERAVIAYQISHDGLSADGIVGDKTLESLRRSIQKVPMISSRPTSYISALPSRPTYITSSTSIINKQTSSTTNWIRDIAVEFVTGIMDVLDNASKEAEKQLKYILSFKNKKSFTADDIRKLQKSLFGKNPYKTAKVGMERKTLEALTIEAQGNTNVFNGGKKAMEQLGKIQTAQNQLATYNKQMKAIVHSLMRSCTNELNSVNFMAKINQKLNMLNKSTKAVGKVALKRFNYLPLAYDVGVLVVHLFKQEPVKEDISKIISDLIKFVEGWLIGIIATTIVGLIGVTGGTAVLIVVVIALILGLIISLLLPDWEDEIGNWIVSQTSRLRLSLA